MSPKYSIPFFGFYKRDLWKILEKINGKKKILLGNGALKWYTMHFHFSKSILPVPAEIKPWGQQLSWIPHLLDKLDNQQIWFTFSLSVKNAFSVWENKIF